jgi:2-oxoglutarate dehydrogenase E2 component (dihydrolipoamide succinyltransferase)
VEASEEVVAEGDGDIEAEAEDVEPHLDVRPTGEGDVEVVMPKMGESITEGTVLAWHKQVGDDVELDELLLEIGTDKVDTDVPSPAAGVLKEILVEVNETVEVGTPLAIIGVEAEAGAGTAAPVPDRAKEEQEVEAARPPEQEQQRESAQTSGVSGDGSVLEPAPEAAGDIKRKGEDGRFYSPLVRSIAEKEGLSMDDLESIPGSGRDGRVTKSDVLNYVQAQKARASDRSSKETKQAAAPQAAATQAAAPRQATEAIDDGEGRESRVEVIKMDRMRQIIAEHMVRSKATSAHVTSFTEADVTNLIRLRERNKESFQEREGVKLTFTPFFVRAAIDALREHPILNSSVEEDQIVIRKDIHVGIAVAIGKTGLVAPVIRSAGQKSLAGLAHAAADLAERARNKKLQPDELQGGTFTLTNIGSLGSLMGTPIINQPQVAILAIGAIKKRPVVIEDPDLGDIIAVRHMMYLSLSYDHRIIDGAMAASFLQRFVRTLEEIDPDEEL